MTPKKEKAPGDSTAKFIGTILGAAIVALLSSGAIARITGDDAKEGVKTAVKSSDMGTALYLSALRDALEARFASDEARIAELEKEVAALKKAAPDALPRPAPEPLPSFEVRP